MTDPKSYSRGTLNSPGQKSLNNRRIGGNYYGRVYGSTIAAPLWRQIMGVAMDGVSAKDWPKPTGKVLTGTGVPIPNVVGRSLGSAQSILANAGFRSRVSSPVPSALGTDRVARTAPSPGGRLDRGGTVTLYPGDGSQAAPPEPTVGGDNGGDNNGGGRGGGDNNGGGRGGGRFD